MDVSKILKAAITSFFALSTVSILAANPAVKSDNNMEKCYGISKAGMNDCQTKVSSCAGSATKDAQRDAFIFLPKGTCDKIVNGSKESS